MKYKVWINLLVVYIVWGSTYLAIRFAVETMPPFLMAAVRFLIAGAILYAGRRLAGDPAPRRFEWRGAAIVGLLLLLGGNGGVVWGEQFIPSGVAALIVGAAPLWMVLLDALRPNGVRPSLGTALGVLIGLGGIALLVGPGQLNGAAGLHKAGVIVLLFGSFSWAAGSLYGRGARLPDSPLLGSGMEMLAGGAGLLLLATLTGEWARLDLSAISARSLLGLGYLIVFGSLVGFASYGWLLRHAPTPLVATYAYVNPLIAIFMGSLLADEAITPRILAAALVIVSSVALINFSRVAKPKTAPVPAALPSTGDD